MALVRNLRFLRFSPASMQHVSAYSTGELGSGAGQGGGGGGSIRDAGGAFGKREVAFEEEYFHRKQREQLLKMKQGLTQEIHFHEEQIKRHEEAIKRHQDRVHEIDEHK